MARPHAGSGPIDVFQATPGGQPRRTTPNQLSTTGANRLDGMSDKLGDEIADLEAEADALREGTKAILADTATGSAVDRPDSGLALGPEELI